MPQRSDNPRSVRQHRSKLLCVAESLLIQATRNADLGLSWAELETAHQAAAELSEWPRGQPAPTARLQLASGAQGRASASDVALFSLALRRSSPFVTGGGMQQLYASLRQRLSSGLRCAVGGGEEEWKRFCAEVLAPALLRTDMLECYSRLLAEAAEQLQPAALAALPATAASASMTPATQGLEAAHGAVSTTSGQQQHKRRAEQAKPAGQAGKPRPGQPNLNTLAALVAELQRVLLVCLAGVRHFNEQQQEQQQSGAIAASDSDSSQASSVPSPQPADNLPTAVCSQLQSSWVLEHWARVLLLGTAPALAGGDSAQQQQAQAMQVRLLHSLSLLRCVDWFEFVRRPWGCALAATHMAHLCAALDGGHAFGGPRPDVFVLPGAGQDEQDFAAWRNDAAVASDALVVAVGRALSLLPALEILRAWISILELEPHEGPRQDGVGADGGMQQAERGAQTGAVGDREGATTAAAAVAQQGGLAAGKAGPLPAPAVQHACRKTDGAEAGAAGGVSPAALTPPAVSPGSGLPPLNRPATVALCLRLAKGVLARWGGRLGGVRLFSYRGSFGSAAPLLPKVDGCSVLHHALACARLALLPDVWGRERVPRRTRAQLRAWWETYMAATQHPEALAVAAFRPCEQETEWTEDCPGAPRPSADASEAVAAGLMPCMTRLVTRMGAGGGGGAFWCVQLPFSGLGRCWAEVMLHGPLGQVGELVSAVGSQLRLAEEELRRATAAGWRHGGSDAKQAADGAAAIAEYALFLVFCIVLGGLQIPQKPDANAALRFSWAAAELLPAVSHVLLLCLEVCNEEGSAVGLGCGAVASGESSGGVQLAGTTLWKFYWCSGRILSFTVPLLAKCIRAAAAGTEQDAGRGGGGSNCGSSSSSCSSSCCSSSSSSSSSNGVSSCGCGSGGSSGCNGGSNGSDGGGASGGVAADHGLSGGGGSCGGSNSNSSRSGSDGGGSCGRGDGGRGGGSGSSNSNSSCCDGGGGHGGGGGSSDDSSTSTSASSDGRSVRGCAAATDHGMVWRQLLLRDVRLMELLGAAVELHSEETVAAFLAYGKVWVDQQRAELAHVLALSAAAFPVELRAAVGRVGAEGGAGTGTGTGTGAGAGAGAGVGEGLQMAVGGAGAGAAVTAKGAAGVGLEPGAARGPSGAVRSAGASSTAKPCISLVAMHEALRGGAFGEQLEVVDRVLGGWDPTPDEVWDLVCSCCYDSCDIRREQLEALMPLMLPPAEARAAAAAAVAASSAAS